ncbi:hypothetical protein GW846_02985 [Candidatus Gracilibacteria bacterium]|nr:hypothetical protein [Candidatus Gracilibacteria bacterium]
MFEKKEVEKRFTKKSLLNDLRIFLISVAIIMIWRGIWNLLDHFFLPQFWVLSSILSIVIGIAILVLNDNNLEKLGEE